MPAPTPSRIVIVRNPRSGTAVETAALEQALHEAGIRAGVRDLPEGSASHDWIDGLCADHDVIAAAGGDGTVSKIAAGVARAGKTLAIIPTGTRNHFARDAGIPTELAGSVALLRAGTPRPVDAGFVNGHCFLNNVSIGSYPKMVSEREALERAGRSRRAAGMIATARTWWRLRSVTASIRIDDRDLIRRSPFIVVGNGSYDLSGFDLGKRHHISDQRLSLYVAPVAGRLGAMSIPFRALFGTLARYERFETHCAQAITVALAHRHVLAGIDGEVVGLESPLRFTVEPGALRVIVP